MSVRTSDWSALQLVPQGVDGAALTMMLEDMHAALLSLVLRVEGGIAPAAREINSSQTR